MVWVRWNDSSKTTKDWGGDVKSSKVGRTKEPGSRGEVWAWGAPEANLKSDLFMAVGGKINSAWACTSDRHTYFLLIIGSEAGAHHSCVVLAPPPAPTPLPSLSDYSFFKKPTSPCWAEFINKFGFDCMHQSPHQELICIHTNTLVDVPSTR